MERKQIFILLGGLLACMIVLVAIYAFSPLNQKPYRASFTRNFVPETYASQKAVLDLGVNSYYLAGSANNHLYLGNSSAPLHLLITNTLLNDTQHISIDIENKSKIIEYKRLKLNVDSPYFFLMHGTMPALFRGKLSHPEAKRFMPDDSAYFVESVPISRSSFALRSYSSISKSFELGLETSDTPHFQFKYGLLEKQIDGLFCVDGKLHYNSALNQLIYLYSYRNQYIVMDSSLNLISRHNTIDTFKHALVKVAHVESKNYSTLATPPTQINGHSSVDGHYLYIQSNLLANNEDEEKFMKNIVIDVYNIKKGVYVHSFYLSEHQTNTIAGFLVFNKQLAAIYDHYLVLYNLQ